MAPTIKVQAVHVMYSALTVQQVVTLVLGTLRDASAACYGGSDVLRCHIALQLNSRGAPFDDDAQ